MTVTSKLKDIVDLPVWEQLRFFPAATPALSGMCASVLAGDRYMYAISAQTFWRYDLFKDTWQQLSSPNIAPLTTLSLGYVSMGIYYGKLIRSLSNITAQIAGFSGRRFKDHYIRIVNGTGVGQQRIIYDITDPTIHDQGVITAVSNVLPISMTDSTKKWDINQWSGYHCKIVFGTGAAQYRKVLYNDATTLTFGDTNWQQYFPAGDAGWSAQAPFFAPVITAGSQAHYTLESQTITLDSQWTTPPDDSSLFSVIGGVITLVSSAAALPFYTLQAYDILSDTWTGRTATNGPILGAALATDVSQVCISELPTPFDYGLATSVGTRTLTDTQKTWVVDQWTNYRCTIIAGTGSGATCRIVGNKANYLEVAMPWQLPLGADSQYAIIADLDVFYAVFGGQASMGQYSVFADQTSQGSIYTYGTNRVLAFKPLGLESLALTTAVKNTNGIVAIATAPTAGGSGYVVGDVLTVSGGSNGKVIVTSTESNGIVTGIALQACGSGYTGGAGVATSGGTGSLCTIQINLCGNVGLCTTVINHAIKTGDNGLFSGDVLWQAAGLYSMGLFPILCSSSLTTFYIYLDVGGAAPAGNATAASAVTTSLVVDCAANWTIGEHIGKVCMLSAPGSSGVATTRRITANTATTLTLQSATTLPVAGTTRYLIHDVRCFGRAEQYRNPVLNGRGYATAGTTQSLTDSGKAWIGNQWAGYKLKVTAGTGFDKGELTIASNTATVLTFSAPIGFTPDVTTKYNIMTSYGLLTNVTNTTNATLTDTTKNWTVNQWAGKIVRINSGTGQGFEKTITSNTATILTLSGTYVTPPLANESTYNILEIPVRGAGMALRWLHGTTHNPGRFMVSLRGGGSNTGDLYDITTELWALTYVTIPQGETYTTGTMMYYDGHDKIYIQKDATGRIFAMNVLDGDVESAGTVPYAMGTALIGQKMCIIETVDGLKYLYILRHTGAATGTEMYRILLY